MNKPPCWARQHFANLFGKMCIRDSLYNRTIAEESEKVKAGLGVAIEGVEDQVTIDVIPGYTPADDIIEFAKEIEADLIVMGAREMCISDRGSANAQ